MIKKDTSELQNSMMEHANLDHFLAENRENFQNSTVPELLLQMIEKKGISKAVLAKQAGMSEVYLHQVFAGRRNPSRSRVLCICFGLNATLEETQELLKQCSLAQLYPREKRDAIIIYGLLHGLSLFEVNDKLFEEDEETLF